MRHVVLRRDEPDRVALPALLGQDQIRDLRILRAQCLPSVAPVHEYSFFNRSSNAVMFSIRAVWRPPSNGVLIQMSKIFIATASPVARCPTHRTFASLCRRENSAVYISLQTAARIPWILLATIASPLPEPATMMPRSASPSATARATASDTTV